VAIRHFVRQAERDTECAHLMLEQFAQRLQQLQVSGNGPPDRVLGTAPMPVDRPAEVPRGDVATEIG
jgi:hypothetical protein